MKERIRVQKTFCWKISSELTLFKNNVMQKPKEEIYGLAYRIDCIITIYEILMELSETLPTEELNRCIATPGLLTYLYGKWLKEYDSRNSDVESAIRYAIGKIEKKAA